ncbi:MAG: hypothetical protein WC373_16270 [Smithella sp.]|jgi:hypothetical protein
MKHLASFLTLFIIICFCSVTAVPSEIHIWVDKKGVINISDREPDNPAKMIGRESNILDSPQEIERYNAQRKAAAKQEEIMQQYTYRPQRFERPSSDVDKSRKEEQKKRAQGRLEYLEINKARLNAIENKDYREARRQSLKAEKLYNERQIEKARDRSR